MKKEACYKSIRISERNLKRLRKLKGNKQIWNDVLSYLLTIHDKAIKLNKIKKEIKILKKKTNIRKNS